MFTPMGAPFTQEALRNLNMRHVANDADFLQKMNEGRQAVQGGGWTNRHFDPVAEEFRDPAKGEMKRAKGRVIEPLALPEGEE